MLTWSLRPQLRCRAFMTMRWSRHSLRTEPINLSTRPFCRGVGLAPVPIVRHVGHIRVFAALASLASVAVLLHAVFISPAT